MASVTKPQGVAPLSADVRPSTTTVVVATVLVVANLVLFTLIAEDVVNGGGLISHDEAVLTWFVDHRTDWLIHAARLVSTAASFVSLLIVGLALGIGLLRWGTRLLVAAAPVVTLCLASLAATSAKSLFGRERPPVSVHATTVTLAAFPSGHATDAAGFFLAASLTLALTVADRRSVQIWLVGVGLGLAALVGVSRLVLGVHWLSDVVAGWALGSAIAIVVVTILWYVAVPSSGHRGAGDVAGDAES
jgi:undecaprenyl-diphosphatase